MEPPGGWKQVLNAESLGVGRGEKNGTARSYGSIDLEGKVSIAVYREQALGGVRLRLSICSTFIFLGKSLNFPKPHVLMYKKKIVTVSMS